MPQSIKVYAIKYRDRPHYVLRWTDPTTGRTCSRSSKCTKRRDAEKAAISLETELNAAIPRGDGAMPFATYLDVYSHRHLHGMSSGTRRWHLAKLSVFESTMEPTTLSAITAALLSQYVDRLRTQKRSEVTIRGHLIAIRCALAWAVTQGYLCNVPAIPPARPLVGRKSKGRALSDAEFQSMLDAVPQTLLPAQVDSWQHLLRGLWLSGLRLNEAVKLSWTDHTAPRINLSETYPMLEIDAEDDKGRQHRLLPITPDFGAFLLSTPVDDRTGHVFAPLGESGQQITNETNISRTISSFGKKAQIIVDHRRNKYASAHDMRRSFGTRWAKRVLPAVLKDLMRHASIDTTMKYYVTENAQSTAADLWRDFKGT